MRLAGKRSYLAGLATVLVFSVVVAPTAAIGADDEFGTQARGQDETVVLYDDGTTRVVQSRDGWVRWSGDHDPSAPREVSEGVRDDAGRCVFSFHETLKPGTVPEGKVMLEMEVAYNETTCQIVMIKTFVDATTVGVSAWSADRNVYQQLRHVDPPGWTVNWIKSDLSWTFTGTCVTWAWYGWDDGWMAHTDWGRDYFEHQTTFECSLARLKTWGRYKNQLFCDPTSWTYTKYRYNTVTGYGTGAKGYGASATKWGDCASWLSLEIIRR